nr:MAG TPA: hypothetical protein [Caudoviricetes sp.]
MNLIKNLTITFISLLTLSFFQHTCLNIICLL